MVKLLLFSVCVLYLIHTNANPLNKGVKFIILHNNDMHARFDQTSANSGKCTPEQENSHKCYGGFARVAYEVRKFRKEASEGGDPVFYLNAGDTYTGTPWFAVFKDNITAAFLNKLQPDAISLGNHEFDENVAGLVPFLNAVNFPVLACNLDLRKTPEIEQTRHFAKSTILETNGVKVGVIGYLTPDTKYLAAPNEVEYYPEIESINKEASKMVQNGIHIIIALGHSGYQRDQEIAAGCPDVDIVIGGHTNTFLYNGKQPDSESIDGPYPTVVKQPNGKKVPVVQAYAYTKYLGKLDVQFDGKGDLIKFNGKPILLNASVPFEDDVLRLLEVYRANITALEKTIVGHTKVNLDGRTATCRRKECNLGNMIADAMVDSRVHENAAGIYWTDAPIAIIMGGGIRSSIELRSDGSITENDVLTVLPFDNDLFITSIKGKTLRKAFEHSASLRDKDSNGGFLQTSGVHVVFDYNKNIGSRVVSIEARCARCKIPMYEQVNDTAIYNVIVPEFLLDGGDGHVFHEAVNSDPIRLQNNDKQSLIQYLQQRSVVNPEIEGRIRIIESTSSAGTITYSTLTIFVTLLISHIYA